MVGIQLQLSGLLFGLVGRDLRGSTRTWETWDEVAGWWWKLFLEPKLTMVISQCQDYGMFACALRSGLLQTGCKKKQLNWKKNNHKERKKVNGQFKMRGCYRALIQKSAETPYLWRHTPQQKYAFTEDGCECPFSSTTAESSAVAPTLSRVKFRTFHHQSAAPLRDASTINQVWTCWWKFDRLVWDTACCQAHRAPDPVADANMYVRWPKQVRSLNSGWHGLLCRCQHQSLFNVGGHNDARLFELSHPKRQRNFYTFSTQLSILHVTQQL